MRAHRISLSLPARVVLGFWPAVLSQPFLQSLDPSPSPRTFSTHCSHDIGFLFRMVPCGCFPLTSVLRTWPRATTPDHGHAAGSGPSSLTYAHTHQPQPSLLSQPSWHFRFSPLTSRLCCFVRFRGRYSGANEPSLIPPALCFPSLRALQDLPVPVGREVRLGLFLLLLAESLLHRPPRRPVQLKWIWGRVGCRGHADLCIVRGAEQPLPSRKPSASPCGPLIREFSAE